MVAAMLYDRKCGKALTIRPGSNDHVFLQHGTIQHCTAQNPKTKPSAAKVVKTTGTYPLADFFGIMLFAANIPTIHRGSFYI